VAAITSGKTANKILLSRSPFETRDANGAERSTLPARAKKAAGLIDLEWEKGARTRAERHLDRVTN
jgi:hypothetical protein